MNNNIDQICANAPELQADEGLDETPCSESSSLDEVLAGNALFFLLDLRPLYDFVNASGAPRNVKDCLRRINLAAASIEGALGSEGYARAKARDEKMKADLEYFLSQNDRSEPRPPQP
jgi:hypothetical protein